MLNPQHAFVQTCLVSEPKRPICLFQGKELRFGEEGFVQDPRPHPGTSSGWPGEEDCDQLLCAGRSARPVAVLHSQAIGPVVSRTLQVWRLRARRGELPVLDQAARQAIALRYLGVCLRAWPFHLLDESSGDAVHACTERHHLPAAASGDPWRLKCACLHVEEPWRGPWWYH